MMAEEVIEETGVKMEGANINTQSMEELEAELQKCEEQEDYERAAEIQKKIEELKRNQ